MAYSLKVSNLQFKFDKHQDYFFNNLSFTLHSGKVYILTGKNGSGKSTLFRILRGDIREDEQVSGKVMVDASVINLDTDISQLSKQVALVSQDYDSMLIAEFNGEENLRLAALGTYPRCADLLPISENTKKAVQLFNIPLTVPVKLLSGGQRQLLAILAVLQKPVKVLLLDEPTAALDRHNKNYIMQLLTTIALEKDIIVMSICHDKEIEALHTKEQIINLSSIVA